MKYKEYNMIIDQYKKMRDTLLSQGDVESSRYCQIIVEDLEMLLNQGAVGLFPRSNKNTGSKKK